MCQLPADAGTEHGGVAYALAAERGEGEGVEGCTLVEVDAAVGSGGVEIAEGGGCAEPFSGVAQPLAQGIALSMVLVADV